MESQIQFIKLTKCGLNFKIFAKLNYGYTFLQMRKFIRIFILLYSTTHLVVG